MSEGEITHIYIYEYINALSKLLLLAIFGVSEVDESGCAVTSQLSTRISLAHNVCQWRDEGIKQFLELLRVGGEQGSETPMCRCE